MKARLGKIGLVLAVLTVCLAGLGVGYGLWSKTLTITGTVDTGQLSLTFNEPVVVDDANGTSDPLRQCVWVGGATGDWDCGDIDTDTMYCNWGWLPSICEPGADARFGWCCEYGDPANGENRAATSAYIDDLVGGVGPAGKTLVVELTTPYMVPLPYVPGTGTLTDPAGYCVNVDYKVGVETVPVAIIDASIDYTQSNIWELFDKDGDGVEEAAGFVNGICDLDANGLPLAGEECAPALDVDLTGILDLSGGYTYIDPGVLADGDLHACLTPASKTGVKYRVVIYITGYNWNEAP